jgi:hypothetical protein
MFIIVDKLTGELLKDKIYTHEGTAKNQIKKGGFYLPYHEPVVITMPNSEILKEVSNGAEYGAIVTVNEDEFPEINFQKWSS